MITDVFALRYPKVLPEGDFTYQIPDRWQRALVQLTQIVFEDVLVHVRAADRLCEQAERRVARELGVLSVYGDPHDTLYEFVSTVFLPFDEPADAAIGLRMSLIELVIRSAEEVVKSTARMDEVLDTVLGRDPNRPRDAGKQWLGTALPPAITEINQRLIPVGFHYHAGLFQRSDDDLITRAIEAPFWALIAGAKWTNVAEDMKEAVDRRDTGAGDAAVKACQALESVIKILAEDTSRSSGRERGAAAFVEALARSPAPVITEWEAEGLKLLFRQVRNPLSHGPGSATRPVLESWQETQVIEHTMSWIKSLIRRPGLPG